ncbi:MAG: urea ABC transporter permease subunit UrtB [Helicobacteraceae bacterium]|jgi:urea transport system permease protein|nr:urea ABC transporter permease subunit UrtB [Helicobacteraceae bacterium]
MKAKLLLLFLCAVSAVLGAEFEENLRALAHAESFAEKESAIRLISSGGDDRAGTALRALLDGNLYRSNAIVAYLDDQRYINVITLETAEGEFDKITINNRLRAIIRAELVSIDLSSPNAKTRLSAAKELLNTLEEKDLEAVKNAMLNESESSVKKALTEAYDILCAKFESGEEQRLAIARLRDHLSPQALLALKQLSEEEDHPYASVIASSIRDVESARKFYAAIETFIFGLSAASVLLFAAMGLAITFGVMKVINMAHGELIMLGAYTTYALQQIMSVSVSIVVAIPAAFLVSAAAGILIERLVLRRLYARPLEALLATFGISLILQQLVRSIFSAQNRDVKTPDWLSGSLEINGALSITYNRLCIFLFALAVFAFVMLLLNKTSIGLKVRAVTQNRAMAQAMGVNTAFVDSLTFGVGSGIAGVAGVALSQLTNVGPNLGQAYIVDSFMVVVFGGVGNLWGTLLGAFTLGELNKILEPFSGAMLAKIVILIFVIMFIQKRPRGLFPQKGRDAED